MTIKDHIQRNASFVFYRDDALWYRTGETGFLFPVPISDLGTSTCLSTEKGVFFMRWIKKHMKYLETQKAIEAEKLREARSSQVTD